MLLGDNVIGSLGFDCPGLLARPAFGDNCAGFRYNCENLGSSCGGNCEGHRGGSCEGTWGDFESNCAGFGSNRGVYRSNLAWVNGINGLRTSKIVSRVNPISAVSWLDTPSESMRAASRLWRIS